MKDSDMWLSLRENYLLHKQIYYVKHHCQHLSESSENQIIK